MQGRFSRKTVRPRTAGRSVYHELECFKFGSASEKTELALNHELECFPHELPIHINSCGKSCIAVHDRVAFLFAGRG